MEKILEGITSALKKNTSLLGAILLFSSGCSAQTNETVIKNGHASGEAVIKYHPSEIKFYDSSAIEVLQGIGIMRLIFNNEDELKVEESELISLKIIDAESKKALFDYRPGKKLNDYENTQLNYYSLKLDSVFKGNSYVIANKEYRYFIPKGDFPFNFKIYPLSERKN